jgi:hypothetical protein
MADVGRDERRNRAGDRIDGAGNRRREQERQRKSGRTRRRRRCGRYRTSDARTGAGARGSNQTSSGFRFAGRCGDMTCHPHGG